MRRLPLALPSGSVLSRTVLSRTVLAVTVLSATVAALAVPASAAPVAPAALAVRSAVVAPQVLVVPQAAVASSLGQRVTAALGGSTARSLAAAVDVDGLGAVLRTNPTAALPPASNEKLFTTFTALRVLPADAPVFRTTVRAVGAPAGGAQPGNLWLVAGGDPWLTSAQLTELARGVRRQHVTRITGALVVDDSRYDATRRAPGWKSSFVPDESGPLSAMVLDANGWRTDAAYLRDPGLPALARFRDALRAQGVTVTGGLRRGAQPRVSHVLAERDSGAVAAVVRRIDKPSDNMAAELLLKELGRVRRASGTTASGAAVVREVLGGLGVRVGTVADGSGLSSTDRQSAAGELSLLTAADVVGSRALEAALPVACSDGTLATRMCRTAAAGRVHAKTGTLDGVRALTGWTTTASGRRVRFSLLASGIADMTRAREALDRAAVVLSSAQD